MDNCGNVPLRPSVAVLQCRIQGTRERPRINSLSVVLHRLDNRARSDPLGIVLADVHLVGKHLLGQLLQRLRQVPGRLRQCSCINHRHCGSGH